MAIMEIFFGLMNIVQVKLVQNVIKNLLKKKKEKLKK
jgi:hypothetical protein